MSIFDPKGNQVTSQKGKEYKVGPHSIECTSTTTDVLRGALQNSQQAMAQQIYMAAKSQGMDEMNAQARATEAISQISSPFQIEPCAQAVFMLLSQYIEYQQKINDNLANRLAKLDNEKCDIKPDFEGTSPNAASN